MKNTKQVPLTTDLSSCHLVIVSSLHAVRYLTPMCLAAILRRVLHQYRWYQRFIVLLPLWALLCAALGVTAWLDNAANRGITFASQPPPIPWTDGPPLGVNAYNIQFEADPRNVTRTLDMARDLGARYVRMQMPWEDVEISGKGDFEDRRNQPSRSAWAKYDFIISSTRQLGLEPIVRIDRPPLWARAKADATERFQRGKDENGASTGPPDRYADYADFVGAVVARYRGQIRFIQLWNEPNLAYEWNWVVPEPERFVALLQAGYTAAKRANPDVVILFPSLSPTDGVEPRIAPMSELEYLDRVYASGGGAFFDIMSAQAYGLGQPPDEHRYVRPRIPGRDWLWSRPIDTRIDVSRLALLREVMEQHGDAHKAVWISEFGYNSAPEQATVSVDQQRWNAARQLWGNPVSEAQKGDYVIGQMERARREWPWVGVMNVWMLRWGGEPPSPGDPTPYFALLDRDFAPLPAYAALKAYSARAAIAGPGAHAASHAAAQQRGTTWTLRFEGTRATLVGGFEGSIVPVLDGQSVTLTRDGIDDQQALSTPVVSDGTHMLQVTSAAGQPPDYFLVERAPPVPWLWVGLSALLITGLAIVGAQIARQVVTR